MTQPIRLLFGGSFDPVHFGHMRLALECQAHFPGATLEFVPASLSPLKAKSHSLAEQRLAMLEFAVAELNQLTNAPVFSINPVEVSNPGASYTFDTIAGLRAECPDDALIWIMGADSWAQFDRWHRWRELPDLTSLLIVARPDISLQPPAAVAELARDLRPLTGANASPGGIAFLTTTPMAISSSQVRSLVGAGTSAAFLVSSPVNRYIQTHRLYV